MAAPIMPADAYNYLEYTHLPPPISPALQRQLASHITAAARYLPETLSVLLSVIPHLRNPTAATGILSLDPAGLYTITTVIITGLDLFYHGRLPPRVALTRANTTLDPVAALGITAELLHALCAPPAPPQIVHTLHTLLRASLGRRGRCCLGSAQDGDVPVQLLPPAAAAEPAWWALAVLLWGETTAKEMGAVNLWGPGNAVLFGGQRAAELFRRGEMLLRPVGAGERCVDVAVHGSEGRVWTTLAAGVEAQVVWRGTGWEVRPHGEPRWVEEGEVVRWTVEEGGVAMPATVLLEMRVAAAVMARDCGVLMYWPDEEEGDGEGEGEEELMTARAMTAVEHGIARVWGDSRVVREAGEMVCAETEK
ncbi:hypothetical protein EDC01DRAFT_627771 [Geopyxis carbonaria]|nr:hypothetical protein EDC01DRAFT_627771 [Geopyxis carbonaria]